MPEQPWFRINRDLLVYKAFYFFFLSGFGSIFPYLPVYFRQIGLPASQVGLLLGLRPIVQLASAPFWAIMADRYRKRKSVLIMSVLSWLIMTMALAFVEPTNEICEVRQGNGTHERILNYTKVKTGFFRRSLWHQAGFHVKEANDRPHQPDWNVVPIHISGHNQKRVKTASGTSLPAIASKTFNRAQLQLAGKSDILSHDRRTFLPINSIYASVSRKRGKEQQNHLSREENGPSLSLNPKLREPNISKNKAQRERFHNKQGPRFKNRANNTTQTATSKELSLSSEQIKSKHLSRFYTNIKSPGEGNRRKHFSKNFTHKTTGKVELSSRKFGGQNATKLYNITRENVTSNSESPARQMETNYNSSTDKRRENKESPPVVIEFSRIIIPHDLDNYTAANSVNEASGDGPEDFVGPLLRTENLTKFVSHENVLHSKQPIVTQVHGNTSYIFTHTREQLTDSNDKDNLVKLQEKLSKIVGFKNPQKLVNGNSPLVTGKDEVLSHFQVSDVSTQNPVFSNHTLTHKAVLPIYVHNENKSSSKGKDKLSHVKKLHGPGTQIVMHDHRTRPVVGIPDLKETKEGSASNDQISNDVFLFSDSLSGSGNALLDGSSTENNSQTATLVTKDGNVAVDDGGSEEYKTQAEMEREVLLQKANDVTNILPKPGLKGYEEAVSTYALSNNGSLIQKAKKLSGTLQTSSHVNISIGEANESSSLQEQRVTNIQIVENSGSNMQIWMKNLLKTNSFELKRIFTILLVLVVVGEFLEAPSTTLADASLLEHLGEERRYYGKQRLWGSLGFGLSSFFVGVLLERSRHVVCGDQYTDYMICFCVFALLMLGTLFISTTFKFKYKETDTKHASVFSALCNIHYGSCLAAACFMGVGHGMSHSFLNWFLEDLGATKTLMGVAVICRSTFDLLTFFLAGSLIKAVGQIKIMICALISYGIAFTLYSLLNNPWWVLPIEMLVGCTYAASWSACTSYMAGAASSDSVTTIQGNTCSAYV